MKRSKFTDSLPSEQVIRELIQITSWQGKPESFAVTTAPRTPVRRHWNGRKRGELGLNIYSTW